MGTGANPMSDPSQRDRLILDLEVKIKAVELVVMCLLQAQDEDLKRDLLETARKIETKFHMERTGFHDSAEDHRRQLASAFAALIIRSLSGDSSIILH